MRLREHARLALTACWPPRTATPAGSRSPSSATTAEPPPLSPVGDIEAARAAGVRTPRHRTPRGSRHADRHRTSPETTLLRLAGSTAIRRGLGHADGCPRGLAADRWRLSGVASASPVTATPRAAPTATSAATSWALMLTPPAVAAGEEGDRCEADGERAGQPPHDRRPGDLATTSGAGGGGRVPPSLARLSTSRRQRRSRRSRRSPTAATRSAGSATAVPPTVASPAPPSTGAARGRASVCDRLAHVGRHRHDHRHRAHDGAGRRGADAPGFPRRRRLVDGVPVAANVAECRAPVPAEHSERFLGRRRAIDTRATRRRPRGRVPSRSVTRHRRPLRPSPRQNEAHASTADLRRQPVRCRVSSTRTSCRLDSTPSHLDQASGVAMSIRRIHHRAGNSVGALAVAVVDDRRVTAAAAAVVQLADHPGITISDLGRRTALTHSAAVRMVEQLEARGLVTWPERVDRRAVVLTLAPAGHQHAAAILAATLPVLMAALESLTRDDREQLDAYSNRCSTGHSQCGSRDLELPLLRPPSVPARRCPVELKYLLHSES